MVQRPLTEEQTTLLCHLDSIRSLWRVGAALMACRIRHIVQGPTVTDLSQPYVHFSSVTL